MTAPKNLVRLTLGEEALRQPVLLGKATGRHGTPNAFDLNFCGASEQRGLCTASHQYRYLAPCVGMTARPDV